MIKFQNNQNFTSHPAYTKRARLAISVVFIVYLGFVLRLAVFRDSFCMDRIFEIGEYNFALFSDYANVLDKGAWRFFYLFFGNLGWFVPFGMYLRYKHPHMRILRLLFCGFLFSFSIECAQLVFKSGVFELDDLILNVIGVWLGAMLSEALLRLMAPNPAHDR